jgi:hypothetical protein
VQVVTVPMTARLGVEIERPGDGRLILHTGWGLQPFEVFQAVMSQLAPREVLEVARALGLPVPPSEVPGPRGDPEP